MRVWTERCLVLPPSIEVTTLRDATIVVQYQTLSGEYQTKTLKGEPARALQHEMDHDRGILLLDHLSTLNDMPLPYMTDLELNGFSQRQILAYERYITTPTILPNNNNNNNNNNNTNNIIKYYLFSTFKT